MALSITAVRSQVAQNPAWLAAAVRWFHASRPCSMPRTSISPGGRPGSDNPVEEIKDDARQAADTVKEAASGNTNTLDSVLQGAKDTASWAAQAIKSTAQETVATASQIFEKSREDMSPQDKVGGLDAADSQGNTRVKQRQGAVHAGLQGFVPETGQDDMANSPEIQGLRKNVEQGKGPNTEEDLKRALENPDQMLGSTLPSDRISSGQTSPEARAGGQPAGSIQKPDPSQTERR